MYLQSILKNSTVHFFFFCLNCSFNDFCIIGSINKKKNPCINLLTKLFLNCVLLILTCNQKNNNKKSPSGLAWRKKASKLETNKEIEPCVAAKVSRRTAADSSRCLPANFLRKVHEIYAKLLICF